MSIQEEPKLKFFYESNSNDETKIIVEYSIIPETGKKILKISSADETSLSGFTEDSCNFSVDFFVEVVDFLRKKGIISSVLNEKEIPIKNTSMLPLPNIITKQNSTVAGISQISNINSEGVTPVTSIPPFSSFSVSKPAIVKENKKIEGIIVKGNENNEKNIRPVFTNRSTDEDPLAAEKGAAQLRKKNAEKSIKRKS